MLKTSVRQQSEAVQKYVVAGGKHQFSFAMPQNVSFSICSETKKSYDDVSFSICSETKKTGYRRMAVVCIVFNATHCFTEICIRSSK